jgi:hypothetical protein
VKGRGVSVSVDGRGGGRVEGWKGGRAAWKSSVEEERERRRRGSRAG